MQAMTTDILNLSAYTDRINMSMISVTEAARIAIVDLESKIVESGARITVVSTDV